MLLIQKSGKMIGLLCFHIYLCLTVPADSSSASNIVIDVPATKRTLQLEGEETCQTPEGNGTSLVVEANKKLGGRKWSMLGVCLWEVIGSSFIGDKKHKNDKFFFFFKRKEKCLPIQMEKKGWNFSIFFIGKSFFFFLSTLGLEPKTPISYWQFSKIFLPYLFLLSIFLLVCLDGSPLFLFWKQLDIGFLVSHLMVTCIGDKE